MNTTKTLPWGFALNAPKAVRKSLELQLYCGCSKCGKRLVQWRTIGGVHQNEVMQGVCIQGRGNTYVPVCGNCA